MKHIVIKTGEKTAYVGVVKNPTFEVRPMRNKKKRVIVTFENYIHRSGIEYCYKREFLRVPTVKLLNIIQGQSKYDKCR